MLTLPDNAIVTKPVPLLPTANFFNGHVMNLLHTLRSLVRDPRGATVVEYGLIAALLIFVIMVTVQGVATETATMWTRVGTTMANATA